MLRLGLALGIVLVLSSVNGQTRNVINLIDNGYETLLIAIHESVKEDANIVTRLQQIFADASTAMYHATRKRAYFRNITILIPPTWTNKPEYEAVTWETYSGANVLIDHPHPVYGDNPYVQQIGTCGIGGQYMHLTETFLKNKTYSETTWGPSEKVIIHEWGHLRWGLFDEYATEGESDFFFSWGSMEAVRCNTQIQGTKVNIKTGGSCTFIPGKLDYNADCRFVPFSDPNNPKPQSSMMYKQYLNQIYEFCDSAFLDNINIAHNLDAPNIMNAKCGGQSSWEVMREHSDFNGVNNPPVTLTAAEIEPSIRLVQHYNKSSVRRVLLLDVSGSMGWFGRHAKMLQAASDFIWNVAETGSELGIVSFSSGSQTLSPMLEIKDNNTRAQLVSTLPPGVGGGTGIGRGVEQCIKVLEQNGGQTEGSIILLLTDGEENIRPFVADVTPNVTSKGIVVDGIALGPKAEINIGSLAAASYGLNFYDTENQLSTGIYEAYVFSALNRHQAEKLVLIASESFLTGSGSNIGSVLMDETANYRATFNFYYPAGVSLDVRLTDPSGRIYDNTTAGYVDDTAMFTIRLNIGGLAKTGTWTYQVVGSAVGQVSVAVKARPNPLTNTEPIQVHGWLGSSSVTYSSQGYVPVYAQVMQGYAPLANVPVRAVVSCNGAPDVEVPLYDSGTGPDTVAFDGIYSGYLLASQMTKDGRYSLRLDVTSSGGDVLTVTGLSRAASTTTSSLSSNLTTNSTAPFQRVASGGALLLNGFNGPSVSDVHPPSRIDNLKLAYTSYDDYLIILRWTAVGDDLMMGNATRYEIKVSQNNTQLLYDFANTAALPASYPLTCPLSSPAAPGTVETCTLRVPSRGPNVMYYFAIVAIDDVGNVADVSNILPVGLVNAEPTAQANTVTLSTGVLIGVGLVTALALAGSVICGAALIAMIKRRNKRKTDPEDFKQHPVQLHIPPTKAV